MFSVKNIRLQQHSLATDKKQQHAEITPKIRMCVVCHPICGRGNDVVDSVPLLSKLLQLRDYSRRIIQKQVDSSRNSSDPQLGTCTPPSCPCSDFHSNRDGKPGADMQTSLIIDVRCLFRPMLVT